MFDYDDLLDTDTTTLKELLHAKIEKRRKQSLILFCNYIVFYILSKIGFSTTWIKQLKLDL